jgi:hypothetical protein
MPRTHAEVERPASSIEWRSGRLTVDADERPLRDLLATIASKTGAEVRGLSNVDGSTSIHLAGVSLRDGLTALLNGFDYAMFEASATRSREAHIVVSIVGHRSGSESHTPATHTISAEQQVIEAKTVQGPDAYDVVQRLAEQRDLDALRDAASNGDATTRALATQRLARLDPDRARNVALNFATSDDAAQRVGALQVLGGLDSEEAANALGAALLDPEAAVRHAAVVGLTGQRSAAVTRFLELAAHDGDEPVRLLAKDLLARRIANEMPARIP